jgi:hypothetical protein
MDTKQFIVEYGRKLGLDTIKTREELLKLPRPKPDKLEIICGNKPKYFMECNVRPTFDIESCNDKIVDLTFPFVFVEKSKL